MNFKEIIKQEWEKEFPEAAELCTYENSLAVIYEQMIERICIKVWNKSLEQAAEQALIAEHIPEEEQEEYDSVCIETSGGYIRDEHYVTVSKDSILKLKINEQGTDTPEI